LALRPVVTERLPLHQLRPLGLNPIGAKITAFWGI
jgi:hypothetical protein